MPHPGSPDIATIERNVRLGFTMGLGYELATPWGFLFEEEPMRTKRKMIRSLLGVGPMEKETGNGPTFHGDIEANFTIENFAYSVGHVMKLDDIADDLDAILEPNKVGQNLGIEANNYKTRQAFDVIAKGDGATYGNCYDGGPMFSAAHDMKAVFNDPEYNGPDTQSNLTTGGDPSQDTWWLFHLRPGVYRPFIHGPRQKPMLKSQTTEASDTVFEKEELRWKVRGRWGMGYGNWLAGEMIKATELNSDNYIAARTKMMQRVNYRGRKLDLRPTHILVTAANIDKARKLFSANLQGGGDTNTLQGDVTIVSTELLNP